MTALHLTYQLVKSLTKDDYLCFLSSHESTTNYVELFKRMYQQPQYQEEVLTHNLPYIARLNTTLEEKIIDTFVSQQTHTAVQLLFQHGSSLLHIYQQIQFLISKKQYILSLKYIEKALKYMKSSELYSLLYVFIDLLITLKRQNIEIKGVLKRQFNTIDIHEIVSHYSNVYLQRLELEQLQEILIQNQYLQYSLDAQDQLHALPHVSNLLKMKPFEHKTLELLRKFNLSLYYLILNQPKQRLTLLKDLASDTHLTYTNRISIAQNIIITMLQEQKLEEAEQYLNNLLLQHQDLGVYDTTNLVLTNTQTIVSIWKSILRNTNFTSDTVDLVALEQHPNLLYQYHKMRLLAFLYHKQHKYALHYLKQHVLKTITLLSSLNKFEAYILLALVYYLNQDYEALYYYSDTLRKNPIIKHINNPYLTAWHNFIYKLDATNRVKRLRKYTLITNELRLNQIKCPIKIEFLEVDVFVTRY